MNDLWGDDTMIQSPFIKGTKIQHAWDSTSLGWLKECPRKYEYHMINGWSGRGESVHLEFGILYHRALEHFEKRRFGGTPHDEALYLTVKDILGWTWRDGKPWRASKDLNMEDKASLKCRENLVRTVVWYIDKFRIDPAQTKEAQQPSLTPKGLPMLELHFQFEIGFNYDFSNPYSLCGYLDRIVTFQDETFVMDRKSTTTTLSSYYFEQYEPDNQMSLYSLASKVAFATPVRGVIVDAAQIAVGFSRYVRHLIYKTPDQLDEWLKDLKLWLRMAEEFAEANYWPQNDKSCHKYGGCPFREVCSKSPGVRDKFLEANFERKVWNPLEPRV